MSICQPRIAGSAMLLLSCAVSLLCPSIGRTETVIDFDELSVYSHTTVDGSYFDGYAGDATSGSWQSQGATFNTNTFGPGWSYSNVENNSTPGFLNQWAAFTGTDASGEGNYAIATTFGPNGAVVNLPVVADLNSIWVTNTTYAALSMRDGDGFAKKFGGDSGIEPDFFKVTFNGFSETDAMGNSTGIAEFYLADFRSADNSQDYIVDAWTEVDLSGLASSRSFGISFDSSDTGEFGVNTPVYVAIDSIGFSAVPEPSGLLAIAGIATCAVCCRRRRNR